MYGKEAICYYCQEKFVISAAHLERAKVGCLECRKLIGEGLSEGIASIPKGSLAEELGSVQDVNDSDSESGISIGGKSLEEILGMGRHREEEKEKV
jgi:hypothetical protein